MKSVSRKAAKSAKKNIGPELPKCYKPLTRLSLSSNRVYFALSAIMLLLFKKFNGNHSFFATLRLCAK
ncbi:MAG TPA: hypothetical protein VJ440_03530, partial [Candidatus Brocadiaceae bacterium]|nr:hypothetical protein [Candidatus Brocadiaceae bacterium]